MSVLDSILAYKAQKDAQSNADINAIPQGIAAFTAAKQAAQKSQLDLLGTQVTAANAGYQIGQDASGRYTLTADPNSMAAQKQALADRVSTSTIRKNEAQADLATSKSSGDTMSPSRQVVKDKKTSELFSTFETNSVRRKQIQEVEAGLESVPKGLTGKASTEYMKNLAPDSPILSTWQNMKDMLAEIQLDKTARTKGAISDYEMKFFAESVGNDDLTSIPRLKPIIEKYKRGMDATENSQVNAFKQSYKENPEEWEELKPFFANKTKETTTSSGNKAGTVSSKPKLTPQQARALLAEMGE